MNSNQYVDKRILKQISERRYLKKLLNGLILILIIGSIYLIDQRPAVVSLEKAWLAVAIIWVSLYPSLQYLSDQNRPPMPFMPLVGLFYLTSFGLPIFAGELKIVSRFSLGIVDSTSLTLVLLGLIGMNLSFYYSKSNVWKRTISLSLPAKYSLKTISTLLWIFLLLHLANLYSPFINKIPSVSQILDPVGYISYGMFFILWKRNQLSFSHVFFIISFCVPLEIIRRLGSGLLSEVMILGLFMTIVIIGETRRIPLLIISIVLGIYLVFNPVKNEFRRLTWTTVSLSPLERVSVFTDLVYKSYTTPKNSNTESPNDSSGDRAIARSAHIVIFSAVVRDTPDRVPYWNGESYLPLLTSFIPRFIWADKPSEKTGNEFGRRYEYLDKIDNSTSFNLPWIVEMYANFGVIGVILGMSLVGVLLAFLEQKFNRSNMQPLEFVTGTTILFRLIYQESNFSLMIGGIILFSMSILSIYRIFLGNSQVYER